MPSETLRKFWKDFPNSLNPLQLLEKAVTDGAFEHNDQDTDQQPVQADQQPGQQADLPPEQQPAQADQQPEKQADQQPEQQAYQQNEIRNLTTTQQSAGNEVIPNPSRNLRDRKVANYNNLQKLRP